MHNHPPTLISATRFIHAPRWVPPDALLDAAAIDMALAASAMMVSRTAPRQVSIAAATAMRAASNVSKSGPQSTNERSVTR